MRLIETEPLWKYGIVKFQSFPENELPKYAILSHRWLSNDQEVTYQELTDPNLLATTNPHLKQGYRKIQDAAVAAANYECPWLWCDTCCIDKTSSAELSEAINSMYRWYQECALCFAYLADFPDKVDPFTKSEWFERAWTLQELVAPPKLIFYDCRWTEMRNKHELADLIAKRTRIDKDLISMRKGLDRFTVAQKMSWAADRKASRTEDIAYSLLGIFDVNMPMLYGEGDKAFIRLQEEIMHRNADQSIFVWFSGASSRRLFASSPSDFAQCGALQQQSRKKKAFGVNNLGLDIELELKPSGLNTYLAQLAVESSGPSHLANLNLEIDPETGYLCRTGSSLRTPWHPRNPLVGQTRRVTVLRSASNKSPPRAPSPMLLQTPSPRPRPGALPLYGFHLINDRNPLTLVNRWDPQQQWDLGRWSRGPAPQQFIFTIPHGVSASIAMMKLALPRALSPVLIQLAFDFDFNPSCCVSRIKENIDFWDRYRRRTTGGPEEDNKLFGWTEVSTTWTTYLRHQVTEIKDPFSDQGLSWITKSVDRQEFSTTIPAYFTKPHTNLVVKFSPREDGGKEWQFEIDSSNVDLRDVPDIEIMDVKSENEQEVMRRRMDEDDPMGFAPPVRPIRNKRFDGLGLSGRTDTV